MITFGSAQIARCFAFLAPYDGSNRLSTVTDPWGHVLTYHYSGTSAHVSSLSDATETIASYQYPYAFLGWLSEVDYADGSKLVFTYDWGTDALGKISVFKYNTLGDGHRVVTSVTGGCDCGASDESRSWTYDPVGRELSFTDGLGDTTQKAYDSQGNLLSVTDPLSHTYSYDLYNAFGKPGTITDTLGNMSINLYDGNGNLVRKVCYPKFKIRAVASLGSSMMWMGICTKRATRSGTSPHLRMTRAGSLSALRIR
jgi:YD repeat-containing protein